MNLFLTLGNSFGGHKKTGYCIIQLLIEHGDSGLNKASKGRAQDREFCTWFPRQLCCKSVGF